MANLFRHWQAALTRRPLLVNWTTLLCIYASAEFSQQCFNKYILKGNRVATRWSDDIVRMAGRRWMQAAADHPRRKLIEETMSRSGLPLRAEIFYTGFSKEQSAINWRGAAHVIMVGGGIYPPTLYYWYKYLDKRFYGNTVRIALTKVVCDQFIMTPILLAIFFTVTSVLEGKRPIEELRQKYATAFIANQSFWIPAQTVNFLFMPPHLRIAFVAATSFFWINVLCFIKRQKVATKD